MILFRQTTVGVPFFWESSKQPAARWHREGEGPVQYLADTPDGAWAEFLRHEGIVDLLDFQGIRRTMWAISLDTNGEAIADPVLPEATIFGSAESYEACQKEAAAIRSRNFTALFSPSAALLAGTARGWRTEQGLKPGPETEGNVIVLFGPRSAAVAWKVVEAGAPPPELLAMVRHLDTEER